MTLGNEARWSCFRRFFAGVRLFPSQSPVELLHGHLYRGNLRVERGGSGNYSLSNGYWGGGGTGTSVNCSGVIAVTFKLGRTRSCPYLGTANANLRRDRLGVQRIG